MKFLKNLKKNEVVIYAIALMLVTAGYFNFSTNIDENIVETYSDGMEGDYANIGDARLVSSNITEDSENVIEDDDNNDEISEDKVEETENQEIDESLDVLAKEDSDDDYFVNTKLERDKTLASMISTYTKILNDTSISETEKSIAMKEITKLNNNKNAISICENLITTKGFNNCVILVNQDSINVVVQLEEDLSKDKVAKIQNIISREFECEISNIHISQK